MRSRYSHPIKSHSPRHHRSRRLPGAEEDSGRFLKCWNCGFLIDTHAGLASSDTNGLSYGDRIAKTDRRRPSERPSRYVGTLTTITLTTGAGILTELSGVLLAEDGTPLLTELGGSSSSSTSTTLEIVDIGTQLYLDTLTSVGVIPRNGYDGTPASIPLYTPRSINVAVGACPFCGTTNLP